jgi:hypothetical protein
MSYDLLFWQQPADEKRSPAEIATALTDHRHVQGLAILPVDAIAARITKKFPLTKVGGLTFWEGNAAGMFELYMSDQHVHFCCRQLLAEHCNALIEIMNEFHCPLYDPQVDQRFASDPPAA